MPNTAVLPSPGPELVREVRIGFIRQGLTFTGWCRENKIKYQHARLALLGGWNGRKGTAVRQQLIAAALGAEREAA